MKPLSAPLKHKWGANIVYHLPDCIKRACETQKGHSASDCVIARDKNGRMA